MSDKLVNNIFLKGPISGEFISGIIQQFGMNTAIGAHSIFLGQVRSDESDGTRVAAIDYTTHAEIALATFHEIQISLLEKYQLTGLKVYHSIGIVKTGEICFFVMAVSSHRTDAIAACSDIVERVKSELPIWGKIILEDETVQWKENN